MSIRPWFWALACVWAGAGSAAPMTLPSTASTAQPKSLACSGSRSIARMWHEQLLAAIRIDAARPTVHARNLFHVSLAMYDVYAARDPQAIPYLVNESGAAQGLSEMEVGAAISYAAYRVLINRFTGSPGQATSFARFQACMTELGLDFNNQTVTGSSPAAIGNRVAAAVIAHGMADGANQAGGYQDPVPFVPANPPLTVEQPGTGGVTNVNAWQPLIPPGAAAPQVFLTSHWREVTPFALTRPAPGVPYVGMPAVPQLGGAGDAQLKADVLEVIRGSSQLTPLDTTPFNLSPRVRGNRPLGSGTGTGHPVNPVTGQPYPDTLVKRGDFTRVLSEFWADGPSSSTPPGHWNEIADEVSDHPLLRRRIGGNGPEVGRLEWDVKLYFALNGALLDASIATWETKRLRNAARPITLVREMATLGQSSNPALPRYHVNGLPLEDGLVELITAASSAPGQRHAHLAANVGDIAIRAWAGHPATPDGVGGVAWILGSRWIPYQQRTFVTPPFPGYSSGHSAFSRAAAEVLTRMTGSAYFPGGLAVARIATDGSGFRLAFEFGPSAPFDLPYATYFDAADDAGVSRIFGGIHPAYDDFPARVLGSQVGLTAWQRANGLFGQPAALPIPALRSGGLLLLMLLIAGLGARALRPAG